MRITRALPAAGLLLCAACVDEPRAPLAPSAALDLAAAVAPAETLASGGVSGTVFANATTPAGWVLGHFYLNSYTVRLQVWGPEPAPVPAIVLDTGGVRSGSDVHGDVIVSQPGFNAKFVLLASAGGGPPYEAPLALPQGILSDLGGGPSAAAINDSHVAVGTGDTAGVPVVVVWPPTAPGARTWLDPFLLPTPNYPGGLNHAFTGASDINNAGLVVGGVTEKLTKGPLDHAWIWRVRMVDGVWQGEIVQELPKAPRMAAHRALHVNDAGVIGGYVAASSGVENPALWYPDADGRYTQPPRVLNIRDWGIGGLNRCGWLAFTSMGKSDDGYVWNGTTAIQLPRAAGSTGGRANDVSDQGDVVGMSRFESRRESRGVAARWRGAVPPCP